MFSKQHKTNGLNMELGVAALMDMAERRALHCSRYEAELAWREVAVEREHERLGAAWEWLFEGYVAARSDVALVTNSQLPAWVVVDNCVGVLTRVADETEAPQIDWVTGSPRPERIELKWALVPVPPLADAPESFAPPPKRGPATRAILTAMSQHKSVFGRAAVASVFINGIAIVSSLFALQVYDRVVPNFAYATLWFLATGLLVAYLLEALFKYVRLRLMESSTRQLDEALSQYFFDRVMGLKLDRRPSHVGTLVAQIRDYEAVKAFFTSSTLFAMADFPFVLVFILVIYLIGGPVAIVPASFVVVCLLVGISFYRPIAKRQREQNDSVVRRQGLLFEAVAGGDIVKSQGGEAQFGDLWQRATRDTGKRNESLNTATSAARFITAFCQQVSYASIIIVGVYTINAGMMTLGGLIACVILGGRALGNISNISQLLLQWHHARYSLQVLNELLSCETDEKPGRQANTRSAPLHLSAGDLTYGYGGSRSPQLAVPGLEIREGSRVAILGRNGSGKTTLLKLLAGIATPSSGQVRIAGLDYQECKPSWLREVVGYLPQDMRLFSGTLLDNLTLGMSMPPEETIREALDKTGLLTAVDNHPKGLHLPIQEGGAGLSGGQRQLVGITRMVLQNPRIWLLDEPTASLDRDAEAKLVSLIRELPVNRTVLFTTHRNAWLDLAQRVLILDGGKIQVDEPKERVRAIGSKQNMSGNPVQADDQTDHAIVGGGSSAGTGSLSIKT